MREEFSFLIFPLFFVFNISISFCLPRAKWNKTIGAKKKIAFGIAIFF